MGVVALLRELGLFGWAAIIAFWLVWEAVGLLDSKDGWPTFTDLVRKHVPKWVMAAFLGWLTYHFIIEP